MTVKNLNLKRKGMHSNKIWLRPPAMKRFRIFLYSFYVDLPLSIANHTLWTLYNLLAFSLIIFCSFSSLSPTPCLISRQIRSTIRICPGHRLALLVGRSGSTGQTLFVWKGGGGRMEEGGKEGGGEKVSLGWIIEECTTSGERGGR